MGIAKRKFERNMRSLMHFDYPYFGEPGDGMRDEIGEFTWSKSGNAAFVGVEIPVAVSVAGTPKFGYRCLQCAGETDYITGNFKTSEKAAGVRINSESGFEFEFFLRPTAAAAGDIVKVLNPSGEVMWTLGYTAANKISMASELFGTTLESTAALELNIFTHVKARVQGNKGYIIINGEESGECECSGSKTAQIVAIQIGGYTGQLDEFVFRDSATNKNTVPDKPYQAKIKLKGMGGDGHTGALNLTSGTTNINTVAKVTSAVSKSVLNIDYTNDATMIGYHGKLAEGDEVMIIKYLIGTETDAQIESGLYAMRHITKLSESGTSAQITLDSPITEFEITDEHITSGNYSFAVFLVPNYTTVDIAAAATITPRTDNTAGLGGVVIFRSKGDVNIAGKIYTYGTGPGRKDMYQMTHNDLPERFITVYGGGVIILSEGAVITASDSVRIGNSQDGAAKAGGSRSLGATGNGGGFWGGTGYGGGGSYYSCVTYVDHSGTAKAGGVGYGGGGYYGCTNGNVRVGNPAGYGSYRQGVYLGREDMGASGPGSNGSHVMIICRRLNVSASAISTGGTSPGAGSGWGGTGTGFCYLAYEGAF